MNCLYAVLIMCVPYVLFPNTVYVVMTYKHLRSLFQRLFSPINVYIYQVLCKSSKACCFLNKGVE